MNWKQITDDEPKEGDLVICYNGVRPLVTHFKPGLVAKDVPHPMTHFCAVELPYQPTTKDITGIEPDVGRQRIGKGTITTCTVPGCGRGHHAKGLCTFHYMKRG